MNKKFNNPAGTSTASETGCLVRMENIQFVLDLCSTIPYLNKDETRSLNLGQ